MIYFIVLTYFVVILYLMKSSKKIEKFSVELQCPNGSTLDKYSDKELYTLEDIKKKCECNDKDKIISEDGKSCVGKSSEVCASSHILFDSKDGIVSQILGNTDEIEIEDDYDDDEQDEAVKNELEKQLKGHNNRVKRLNKLFFSTYDENNKIDWTEIEDYKYVDKENYEKLYEIKTKQAFFIKFMENWGHLIFAPIFWYLCYKQIKAIRYGDDVYPNWSIIIIPIVIVFLWKSFNQFSIIKISF